MSKLSPIPTNYIKSFPGWGTPYFTIKNLQLSPFKKGKIKEKKIKVI